MENTVNIKINGKDIAVPSDYTVLEAAKKANIHIPTLCYLKDLNQIGACRMCVVEIKGARALQAACVYPVSEGLEIYTNSPKVRKARKNTLELILSNHNRKCLECVRNGNCELQKLANELCIDKVRFGTEEEALKYEADKSSPSYVRDNNKCILCRRCVAACDNQGISVIQAKKRGFDTNIGGAFDLPVANTPCIYCGQCITACPTGALYEKDDTDKVWEAIHNPEMHVVFQTAPAVRAAIGEEFGLEAGEAQTGKMIAAIREIGADKVFDTDTGADLTIMEEGTELIERLSGKGKLPMITSCSPGWVKYCETYYPEFTENLSSAKSPMEMFGAVLKTYYAEKNGIDPDKIFVVAVMPCTSKKFEVSRPEMNASGCEKDVDVSITTRELARMIKSAGIDFKSLDEEHFDTPFGDATGAGVIFGATGGVTEAALRTVSELLTGESLEKIEFNEVRGLEGVKTAELEIGGRKLNVAVAHGTKNAKTLLEDIKSGKAHYDFIEIMACPGGCVCGGGQPVKSAKYLMDHDIKTLRAKALYAEDEHASVRKSHESETVKMIYSEFLGKPCSEKAHKLLHTTYKKRDKYIIG